MPMPRINRHRHHHGHHAEPRLLNLHRMSSFSSPTSPPAQPPLETSPPPRAPTPTQTPRKPNTKILSLLLQALIMTVVVSLFFVFVGVAAIIFIHLCIAGGALHRRHRRDQQPSPDKTRSGYSPVELKTLPRTKFKAETESKTKELCAICLENVSEGDWCWVLPSCKHLFHSNCIDKWLLKAPACPVCRTDVRLNDSEGKKSGIGLDDCAQLWAVFR